MAGGAFQRRASLAVTIHAPPHRQGCDLTYRFGLLDSTMTALTGNACSDMPLVRKVNEIREGMNANPGYGLFYFPVLQDLFNFGALLIHQTVTFITGLYRRDTRYRGARRRRVAVEARDLVVPHMDAVTECNGLNRRLGSLLF